MKTIEIEPFAKSRQQFNVSFQNPQGPTIQHGEWTASVRRSNFGTGTWTMHATRVTQNVESRYFADNHPEGKYPPTDHMPSAVVLASFLEECQALEAAKTLAS